jgi:hydroxymethylpyrimidine pyrophosphatase-like HAD family hydrolase
LSQYYDNIHLNRYVAYNNYSNILQKDFFERMNKYNTKKEMNKKLQQSLKEEEINLFCTFNPDLTLTRKNNFKRRTLTNKKPIYKDNIVEEKPKRKVDNEKMLKLYNDHQQNTLRKQKLKENIDKENGITFSPRLNNDSKYNKNIRDNFYERNNKLIIDKQNFVEGFNLVRDLQMKGIDVNRISIDLSKIK